MHFRPVNLAINARINIQNVNLDFHAQKLAVFFHIHHNNANIIHFVRNQDVRIYIHQHIHQLHQLKLCVVNLRGADAINKDKKKYEFELLLRKKEKKRKKTINKKEMKKSFYRFSFVQVVNE